MLHHFLLYMLVVLIVNLFPGVSHGKRLGLAAALGVGAGCFVHIFAISLGLSSLLFESALAFLIVKYLGVCYLLYLGISSLIKKQSDLFAQVDTVQAASWCMSEAK